MAVAKIFDGITSIVKTIKESLPKKSIQFTYANMVGLAINFASAEINDEYINRKRLKMKIDKEELAKLFKERVQFHINNQMGIFKNQK